jgi:hypothetical protein
MEFKDTLEMSAEDLQKMFLYMNVMDALAECRSVPM